MCIEVISEVTYTYIDLRTLAVTLKLLPRSKAISPSNQRKFVTTCIYSNIIMS